MRYGILSDIHSNLPAMDAILGEAQRQRVERFLCLGDIVGYGASPNECCLLMRELPAVCVRGNHDEAAICPGREMWFTSSARQCILWTREQLTAENLEFLQSLEPYAEADGALLCHGSVVDPDYYIINAQGALPSLEAMEGRLAFFGHTHYAMWFAWREGHRLPKESACPRGCEMRLKPELRYLVNPGAVGQPRDGNAHASFAVWDDEAQRLEIVRVPYDIRAAQQRMRDVNLPEEMALRLELGI